MFELAFLIAVFVGGVLVGWTFPQPAWAKMLQDKLFAALNAAWLKFKGLFSKN